MFLTVALGLLAIERDHSAAQTPPAIYYGVAAPGDVVAAFIGTTMCDADTADGLAEWQVVLPENGCNGEAVSGAPVRFTLNGLVADETEVWEPGGFPGDLVNGITLTVSSLVDDSDGDSNSPPDYVYCQGPCPGGYFNDAVEAFMGTDPFDRCPPADDTSFADADVWPADFNGSGSVNLLDVFAMRAPFGTAEGDTEYSRRFDLNASGNINLLDVFILRPFFGLACTLPSLSNLLGDKDGFGFGLEEGDLRPVSLSPFFFDNREPDDPSFTDVEPIASGFPPYEFSDTHTFVLDGRTITAAELRMLTVGIQDGDTHVFGSDTDVRLFLDDVEVPNAFDDVDQFDFVSGVGFAEIVGYVTIEIPGDLLTLLSDGEIIVRVEVMQLGTAPSIDAFAMDSSELIVD